MPGENWCCADKNKEVTIIDDLIGGPPKIMIKSPQIPNFLLFLLITLSTLVVPQPQIGVPEAFHSSFSNLRRLVIFTYI